MQANQLSLLICCFVVIVCSLVDRINTNSTVLGWSTLYTLCNMNVYMYINVSYQVYIECSTPKVKFKFTQ